MTRFLGEAIGREGIPDSAAELLRQERTEGYPLEYLFSRVRGRRSRLIGDWRPLIYDASPLDYLASPQYRGFIRERTAEGMWRALLQEHGWVYRQMDQSTRKAFAPYFLYAELRTIFICLRYLEGDRAQKAGEVLTTTASRTKAGFEKGAKKVSAAVATGTQKVKAVVTGASAPD